MKMHSLKGINDKYGITVSMLKKMIQTGQITVVKVGSKNFIKECDIESYIDSNTKVATNV